MNKVKNMLKNIANPVFVIAVVILLVLVFAAVDTSISVAASYSEKIDLNSITVKGYSLDENTLTPLNNDPQMNIPCSSSAVNILDIELAKPVIANCTARIYYSVNADQGLSEATAFNVEIPAGSTRIFCELPGEQIYTRIRFDLSCVFTLQSIQLHRGNLTSSLKINYFLLIAGICVTAVIIGFYVRNRKKCDSIIKGFCDKYSCDQDFVLKDRYKRKLSGFYLILALSFGILIIFLSPPNSMPDEPVHFNIASSISKMNFFPDVNENGSVGYFNSYDEVNLEWYRHIPDAFTYDKAQELYHDSTLPGITALFPNAGANPIGHLVAGTGMAIARASGIYLSPYTLMIIGRFTNLLFSALLISISIRKSKTLNHTMFLLALMPTTLYQCSSISYDAVVIASIFLLFASVNQIVLSDNSYRISAGDVVSVCASCFFLFGAKGAVYATFVITLLAIERKKFGNTKKYIACIGLVALTAFISYVVPQMVLNSILADSNYMENESVIQQKEYLLSNLGQVPTIIFSTLKQEGAKFLEGYIGYLGWQDVRMPYPFLLLFVPVLILSFLIEACCIRKVTFNLRLLSFVAFLISFIGIMLSMYIYYAPLRLSVGGNIAYGVQGRYFIPLSLFAMIIFANPALCRFRYSSKIMICEKVMVLIGGISSCLITSFTLLAAYWL